MNTEIGTDTKAVEGGVILAVDLHSQLAASVEIAATLAVARRSALHGLCVEDLDLWQVARLSFTQEITLLGGQIRGIEDEQLRRALDSFAHRFEKLLSERAAHSALRWTLRSVRGRKRTMELGEAEQAELLILGQPGANEPVADELNILALASAPETLLPVLEVMLHHNHAGRGQIFLMDPTGKEQSHRAITRWIEQYSSLCLRQVRIAQLPALCAGTSTRLNYAVAGRHEDPSLLAQIMGTVTCPVIVVN